MKVEIGETWFVVLIVLLCVRGCDACNGRDEFIERARAAGSVTKVDEDGEPICYDGAGVEWCWQP